MSLHRLFCLMPALALAALASDWSAPVEIRHEDELAIAYQAKVEGGVLLVRATLGPGWHTFAMDNKRRADEKLAGKTAISIDRETEITASGRVQIDGPWFQSAPKDFSHPELRWFSWGFEGEALFAAKARRTGAGTLTIRGQACTASVCKNIDVNLPAPADASGPAFDLKKLQQVR